MAGSFRSLILRALPCGAVAAVGLAAGESPERSFTFTVFAAERVEAIAYRPKPGMELESLSFYPTARSPHYRYEGSASFRLYRENEEWTEQTIPVGLSRALMVVTATKNSRPRLEVLDDSIARHPPGKLRILNRSGLLLSGTIGATRVALPDGADWCGSWGFSAVLSLHTNYRERSYRAWTETLIHEAGERVLVLLLPPYRQGALEVQSRILRELVSD